MIKKLKNRNELTQELLKKHFEYEPYTGKFYRITKYDSWGNVYKIRKEVTSKNNRGYLWVCILGIVCLVHRLIYTYMTNKHPNEIDHIDGDRLNNKWGNLRNVNSFENSRNQGNRKDNTSGVRGITLHKPKRGTEKWLARISHKNKRYSLGYFLTKEEAINARKEAEEHFKYHIN